MRQVADEHEVVLLGGHPGRPNRGVIHRCQPVRLGRCDAEFRCPDLSGTPGSGLARVEDPLDHYAAGFRGELGDPADIACAAIGERSLGILLLAPGLSVLNEIEPHGLWHSTPCYLEASRLRWIRA